jgi:bacterioferritin-associated ferredoxin
LQVTEEHLVKLIARFGLGTIQEVQKHTGAGDGCTCCHQELQQYLDRYALAVVE